MVTRGGGPVVELAGGARFAWTGRSDGDMRSCAPGLQEARRRVADLPWSTFRQVHGTRVAVVGATGALDSREGTCQEQAADTAADTAADAAVLRGPGRAVAMLCADCPPIGLASPEGVLAVVHAGWRGLLAGVLEETVAVMRSLGATSVEAVLGPCIRAECYAFGEADLEVMERRFGASVRATDKHGSPALDLPVGVQRALGAADAELVVDSGLCTACSDQHWSWRARQDRQRQAIVGWFE